MHNATTENNKILNINRPSDLHEVLENWCIGVKTAVLQLYGWNMVECVLEPFDVSDNLTVQMKLPKEDANKCWNMLEYQLNSVTWHMRSGALKAGLRNTDNRMTLFNSLQFSEKTPAHNEFNFVCN
jgi:hypothetical protein